MIQLQQQHIQQHQLQQQQIAQQAELIEVQRMVTATTATTAASMAAMKVAHHAVGDLAIPVPQAVVHHDVHMDAQDRLTVIQESIQTTEIKTQSKDVDSYKACRQ